MPRKAFLVMAASTVGLLTIGGSAEAIEATVAPAGAIRAISEGEVSFRGGIFLVRCPLTFEGELERGPIRIERAGGRLGTNREMTPGRCNGGNFGAILNLPWNLILASALPASAPKERLTGLQFIVEPMAWEFSVFGEAIRCLYESEASGEVRMLLSLINGREDRRGRWVYDSERIRFIEAVRIRLARGEGVCPATVTVSGRLNVERQTITAT